MLVPRARAPERWVLQAFRAGGGKGLRFSFEMLRLTAGCCGDDENLLGARAIERRSGEGTQAPALHLGSGAPQ